jgi:bacterioferritin
MKGSAKVVQELNAALSAELTAIVQYMVQAEMHANWGYSGLSAITKKRAFEEMHHAEGLIERLLFLDAVPTVDIALKPRIGANVKSHLETDYEDEVDAVKQYNVAVNTCVSQNDDGSRALFEKMIRDEERHANYLEGELHSIKEMGIQNYLSQQMDGNDKD